MTKFEKERNQVLAAVRLGIDSNIPLEAMQKKYLKNLLLFALMNASANETVTNRNFIKLVNKIFKRFLVKIVQTNSDDDEDDADEGLAVELNRILADTNILNPQELQQILTPANIISFIKTNTGGLSQRQVLDRLLALRDAKANYRETPEEARKREQRQKEYELQRQRERMIEAHVMMHERSRS